MTSTPSPDSASCFAPTRWTLVLRARGEAPEAREALSALCEAYWQPVFRFLRGQGRDDDQARELTQEFFARVLAGSGFGGADPSRGRFRSFLLGAVKHFLADYRARERCLKRGGGNEPEPLDEPSGTDTEATLQVADPAAIMVDEEFDRQWALAVMHRALAALEEELSTDGKRDLFLALQPWLAGDAAGSSQAETAQKLGLSEGAMKVAIHRLRKRFREVVRREIGETLEDPSAAKEELRYLVEVLARN